MKIKRQYFNDASIKITREPREKIKIKIAAYRDSNYDVQHEVNVTTSACNIRFIADQLHKIIDSYEEDVLMARRSMKGNS